MVLLLVFMQLTRDLFAIAKFLLKGHFRTAQVGMRPEGPRADVGFLRRGWLSGERCKFVEYLV